jgi:hypothetical protein
VISNVPEERGARQKLVANGSGGDLEKKLCGAFAPLRAWAYAAQGR